ncbi:MAG: 1-deoxy-D-xylulose-5-phosphate synthase [Elusimicrobia bacterium]|nr:1-deoxy-D-xylulose-5-phosphate synthase [Elusimicrobiota bacterium]
MKFLQNIKSPSDLKKIKVEKLPDVAKEIRKTIVDVISGTGGHLASSLGATDLIIALHYVYDMPLDKIVFDTGHQAYAHKILTGRYDKFKNIRQKGGISGFLKREESEYDVFGAGHASTALSAACGIAAARDYYGYRHRVVAVVSDGCMTGGMSWEAMQNIGQLGTDILVVLNDNQMFISRRVGTLAKILTKLLTMGTVQNAERRMEIVLGKFKFWGKNLLRVAKRARVLFFPGMVFEEMGFSYFGPVDGHNIPELVEILGYVKNLKGPVLLHVVTKKGKGYDPAEDQPIEFHGAGKFDVETGLAHKDPAAIPTFTRVFSDTILKLAEDDSRIVAITAAMPEGAGLDSFRDKYPDRYYDVGIAEGHAVTFAAGMAVQGLKPVAAIYSSFMQRAFDQVMHDVCLQKLPVVIAMDRAGIVGEDGPTHHGVFDMGLFRMLPNIVIMAPADENELRHMLKTAFEFNLPVFIRYPRGKGFGVEIDGDLKFIKPGTGIFLKKGKDLNILAIGNRVHPALKAAELLKEKGIDAGVADMRFVKPLDLNLIEEAAAMSGRIVTVEDNALLGGFGSYVLETAQEKGIKAEMLKLGIPDAFVGHGRPDELYKDLRLDSTGICERILNWIS